MRVTWDPEKAEENLRKHGVSFEEGATIFDDPLIVSIFDDDHSDGELRLISIGESVVRHILVVWYAIRDDITHLIGTRVATRAEKRRYMRGDMIRDEPPLDEMKPEYDFTNGVRGMHYFPDLRIPVWLDPDVRRRFPTEKAVNDALRAIIEKESTFEILEDD